MYFSNFSSAFEALNRRQNLDCCPFPPCLSLRLLCVPFFSDNMLGYLYVIRKSVKFHGCPNFDYFCSNLITHFSAGVLSSIPMDLNCFSSNSRDSLIQQECCLYPHTRTHASTQTLIHTHTHLSIDLGLVFCNPFFGESGGSIGC